MNNALMSLVLMLAVVALIVWRQLGSHRVKESLRTQYLLVGMGAVMTTQFFTHHGAEPALVVPLLVGVAASIGLAIPRANSLRVWRDEQGVLMCRGTAWTVAWWVAVFVVRFGVGNLLPRLVGVPAVMVSQFEGSAAMLTVGVSLLAQQMLLLHRAGIHPTPRHHAAIA